MTGRNNMPKKHRGIEVGPTKSIGVGLKQGEIDDIDEIAHELGFSRNAIMAWMIRHVLRKIQDGELKIPIETTTEVKRYLGEP